MFSIITSPVKTIKSCIISMVVSRLKNAITPSFIRSKITVLINNAIDTAIHNIDETAIRKYCTIVSDTSHLCEVISSALKDKEVTCEETEEIISSVESIVGRSLKQEDIDRIIDGIADRLKGSL